VTIGSKANDNTNFVFIATFFEFLVALNNMVANESGVQPEAILACKIPELLKLEPNLVLF
jgi:hypothetical protein